MDSHPAVRDSLRPAVHELTEARRANNDVHRAHQAFALQLESMNVEKQLLDYEDLHEKFPMYRWGREASNGSDAVPTSHTGGKLVTLLVSTGKALCLLFCI